jgi:hypothetical protein
MVTIVEGLTGSSELGLALAAIRRAHDILWIAWGLAIGWAYSTRPEEAPSRAVPEPVRRAEPEVGSLTGYSAAPPETDSIAPREDRAR